MDAPLRSLLINTNWKHHLRSDYPTGSGFRPTLSQALITSAATARPVHSMHNPSQPIQVSECTIRTPGRAKQKEGQQPMVCKPGWRAPMRPTRIEQNEITVECESVKRRAPHTSSGSTFLSSDVVCGRRTRVRTTGIAGLLAMAGLEKISTVCTFVGCNADHGLVLGWITQPNRRRPTAIEDRVVRHQGTEWVNNRRSKTNPTYCHTVLPLEMLNVLCIE